MFRVTRGAVLLDTLEIYQKFPMLAPTNGAAPELLWNTAGSRI